ncbi:hypothetical protein I4F81_008268 [Pyropia yezoensis]|uniref:Uncharacterized protein n=1 Tax=Pyropia yezoensis TaxID=2788 RepID=A0ACC3C7K2_PYRYE|nr:hypothetical protein I4F81_008268 [Neopyropia yezoensis]
MAPALVAAPAFVGAAVGPLTAPPRRPRTAVAGRRRAPFLPATAAAACRPRRSTARMMAGASSDGGSTPPPPPSSSGGGSSNSSSSSSSSGDAPADGDGPSADPAEQHDIPPSAVDWNAEWSRYAATGYAPTGAPKGRTPMTSAEKAARAVNATVGQTRAKVANTVPPWSSLKGDWRFWLAVIGGISLVGAALNAVAMQAGGAGVGTV